MIDGGARVLEEKHMISTLLFLSGNDGCNKSELYRAVSTNPRMPDKLDILERAGLIRQDSNDGSRAVNIRLTDLGNAVSAKLAEIDSLMSRQ